MSSLYKPRPEGQWMPIALVKVFGNALSLIGALLFLALFIIAPQYTSLINARADLWIEAYSASQADEFRALIRQVRQGRTDRAIRNLRTKWKDVQKGDRSYRLKRRLLRTLAGELHKQKRYQELLAWSSEWTTLDGRDIDAVSFGYEALYRSIDRRSEGFDGLQNTWKRFPYSTIAKKFYLSALAERRALDDVSLIMADYIQNRRDEIVEKTNIWKIFLSVDREQEFANDQDYENYVDSQRNLTQTWALIHDYSRGESLGQYPTKHGLRPSQQAEYWVKKGATSKSLFGKLHHAATKEDVLFYSDEVKLVTASDNQSHLSIIAPLQTKTLRIDLPDRIKLQIKNIQIRTNGVLYPIPLGQVRYNNMSISGNSLNSSEERDPHFMVKIDHLLKKTGKELELDLIMEIEIITDLHNIPLAEFLFGG